MKNRYNYFFKRASFNSKLFEIIDLVIANVNEWAGYGCRAYKEVEETLRQAQDDTLAMVAEGAD